ncbi:Endoglucanase precursor [Pelotomaculum schinkii]|uniref:Endoglucanase n=1 Tax=Pelotomaculum schinkii TaxID=78350 RepID=A0A4Y7R934_9FIRM|nr:S-layer homology domain-containing protein [Pelotomaculum schinkii]TEB05229.1 Endoglucanase precursor [Pelotomaculum schinkii]
MSIKSFRRIIKNIVLVSIILSLVAPFQAYAYQVNGNNVTEEIITQGVVLHSINLNTNEGPLNVYVLEADLSNPYVKIDTIIGSDGTLNKNQSVLDMAKRTGAVAAINGDFFQMAESGRTIGLAYQGGQLVESPALRNDMYGFGITEDKLPLLEIFNFTGQVVTEAGKSFPLAGINKPGYLLMNGLSSDVDALNMYTTLWGTTSRGKISGLTGVKVAVVRNGVVQQVLTDQPGVTIPQDGFVLQGHGLAAQFITDNMPVGTKVAASYSVAPHGDKLLAAVGGQALLVEDGHLPAYFTQNISGKVARTAVGVSSDGKTLYLVAVERKAAADGTIISRGMSQEELAEFLISIGVWRAVNLDGGGSTTMAARSLGDFEASLINQPQGSSLRSVADAIGVFSTAPQGSLHGMALSGPSLALAGTQASFSAKGYDQYYNPVSIKPADIKWSATPSGDFTGNVLIPKQGGTVTVTAKLDNVQSSVNVQVVGPESLLSLAVTPSAITVKPGEKVPLSAKVNTIYGDTFDLKFQDVTWTISGSIGKIADGSFTATDQVAEGEIKATFQGLSTSIPVTVKPSWVELQALPEQESSAGLDSWIHVTFPASSVSAPATIRLAYAAETTGLPANCINLGAITVSPAPGEKADLMAPWWLSWDYQPGTITGRPAILMWDDSTKKWEEQPARLDDQGEVKTISARVWGFGQLVLVDDHRRLPSFKDTGKHWAEAAINDLAARGVANGFPDGTFLPGQAVTRAQFVKLLSSALQWPAVEKLPAFKDSIPDWASSAVAAAVANGVVSGYPDGTFRPDASITRSEMAVMIDRALALQETDENLKYKDTGSIPDFARTAVAKATSAGLLQGEGGLFRPKDGATRAETAVVVSRVLKLWVEK